MATTEILQLETDYTVVPKPFSAPTAEMISGALDYQGLAWLRAVVAENPDGVVLQIPDDTSWEVSASGVISPGAGIAAHSTYKGVFLQTTSDYTITATEVTADWQSQTGLYLYATIEVATNDSRKTAVPKFVLSDSATYNGGVLIASGVATDTDSITAATDARALISVFPSTVTGTGFVHVTGGLRDAAAKLVEDADVHASAAIALSKLATNPLARANHTGTQTASTISDFNSAALSAAPAETTTTAGALINGATGKSTPVDADYVGLMDSAASNVLKKLSWANVKATLKTYFDTLYAPTSAGVSDGDKGDVTVSSSGAVWTVDNDVVTYAKMQNVSAASKLLGRGDSGSGDPQEITLGTGLTMTGTTLSSSDTALVEPLNFVIDGGGSAITTGIKGDFVVPYACTIQSATLLADQSGSIVIDLWKDTYANFPPVDADSITASAPPTISSATKSQDTVLTGWTTLVAAGDVIRVNVDSATTVQRVTLSLKVLRS